MAPSGCEVVSFLGVPARRRDPETGREVEGRYDDAIYVWGEEECSTHLFPLALQRFFHPRRLHLVVTEAARRHGHFEELLRLLGPVLNPIAIPSGRDQHELWTIFNSITGAVSRGSRIVFDITHGFRSLPFLAFLTVAYLRRARKVSVRHIVYGNREAGDWTSTPPRVPVFDLVPFVDLLDWLTGVEALRRRDDADPLADLLREAHERPWRRAAGDSGPEAGPRRLAAAAGALQDLSRAVHLARPLDLMQAAAALGRALPRAREEVARWAPPFALLVDEVEREYGRYAHPDPCRLDAAHLRLQLDLIERYVSKDLAAEAVLLAREWLVNLVLYLDGVARDAWLVHDRRKKAEEVLRTQGAQGADPLRGAVPRIEEIRRAWDFLHDLRNDVAHCGFRTQPRPAEAIAKSVREVPERLRRLLPDTVHEGDME